MVANPAAAPSEAGAPVRGRPRNPRLRAAVLQAARELLEEVGYAATTIQSVAQRSGVSRPTLYQYWGDRLSLLEDALYTDHGELPLRDTGSLAGDLAELVGELVVDISRPEVMRGLPSLQAEAAETRGAHSSYWQAVLARWQRVFARAAERGELPGATAAASQRAELALHMTIGSLFFLVRDPARSPAAIRGALVAALLGGVTAPACAPAGAEVGAEEHAPRCTPKGRADLRRT